MPSEPNPDVPDRGGAEREFLTFQIPKEAMREVADIEDSEIEEEKRHPVWAAISRELAPGDKKHLNDQQIRKFADILQTSGGGLVSLPIIYGIIKSNATTTIEEAQVYIVILIGIYFVLKSITVRGMIDEDGE